MNLKIIFKLATVIAICLVLLLGQGLAQVITANISGTITDMENAPLPGATVALQNTDTGFSRSVTTDGFGKYFLRTIPTQGKYTITVNLAGFKTQVETGLQFHPNENYTINFKLEISALEETITVEAKAPLVDVKKSTVQQVLTEDLVKSLPLIGRNYIQLAHLTPGVTGYDFWPTTSGQHYWAMNYYVDGSSNFSKWRSAARTFYSGYSLETIKEVQILNNQFSVEFGEGMSAINSAVTKSGTNELHGSLFIYERPGKWDKPDIFTGTKAPFDQQQVGFSLGGPIEKDKAHFFLSYEYRRQRSHNIVLAPQYYGQSVPNNQDEHEIFVKADVQLTAQDYLSARYSADLFDWMSESGGYSLPGELYSYVTYVHTANVSWTKTLSANSVNELRGQVASYYDFRKNITNYPDRAAESRYLWASFGSTMDGWGVTPEMTYELFEKYTMRWKNHFFKLGGFFKYTNAEQKLDWYTKGYYYFLGAPDKYPNPYYFMQYFILDPSIRIVHSKDIYSALFFEDEWSVGKNFTLTLGLRYDVEYIFDVKGYTAPPDWNNIEPRLGFAYDLFGNGKSVLRAGFGTFSQQQLTYHFTKGAFYGPEGQVVLILYPGDPNFPTYPYGLQAFPEGAKLPPRNIWEIDDHLKNPYSIQATLGFQQEILPSLSISADIIYMTVKDGLSVIDSNAPASPTGPRTLAQADATRPITPTWNGFRTIQHLGNLSRSWYKALNLKIERRASDFTFLFTYTLSKTTDMLNPWTLPQDSRNIEDDKGTGNQDRRHMLNFAFFLNSPFKNILLKGWQISGIAKYNSPFPYTETYGLDVWGTNLFNARPYERNNLRGDSYCNLDLSLSRRISVAPIEAELKFDIFNIFNTKNYSSYYGSRLAGGKFKTPAGTTPPRRFQLGLHIRF
jgi:hypothetical protein